MVCFLFSYLGIHTQKDQSSNYFYFMCVNILPSFICVCHLCAWCPERLEEGIRSSELLLQRLCKHHVDQGNKTWVFFQEQQVLLTTDLSLWPQPPLLFEAASHLAWCSASRLGWLASECQEPADLYLFRAGITTPHDFFRCIMSLGPSA